MISNIFSQTIFFSLRFLTFAFSAKKFKAKKKETFERKKRKENYQFVSLKNISIDRGTNRGQKKFLCNRSDSYDTCAVNARRSTGSISLYRCGVYIGLFAMLVDVSCVRGVKWAAWHLQLQPLGLNKGRSLAAFPTQLSPFYHGFHSCFISSVSLHRVHTMRRHLGRVHSSVFSIFFPSCFWLLLFSSLLFFFLPPLSLSSRRPVPVRREPTIRRLQPIRKLYPLLRWISMITEVLLERGRTCRLAFVSSSALIVLHVYFFIRVWIGIFSIGLIHQWNRIHRIPENRGIGKFIASSFHLRSRDLL